MSSTASTSSEGPAELWPDWLTAATGLPAGRDGDRVEVGDRSYVHSGGIWRATQQWSQAQAQTADSFGFKWAKRATFEGDASMDRVTAWLVERYGDVARAPWWSDYGDHPLVVDAGCGAGMSALALFGSRLAQVHYLGVDVSTAVDVAAARFAEQGIPAGWLQADLVHLPIAPGSVDVIFSEGVLHHTDSTEQALTAVAGLLAPGGRILFYVYRRKGPIREFTDDYVRAQLQAMTPEEGWDALTPLTELGRILGDLEIQIDIPADIDLLDIPAGPIDLQRFFYWHVCKMFHQPGLSTDELNHINFDWFAPRNAHRQSLEEVRAWCEACDLDIEREDCQEAGITIIGRRR
jgi:arsenite methyltransferase